VLKKIELLSLDNEKRSLSPLVIGLKKKRVAFGKKKEDQVKSPD